jgi:hypothetical protein
VVVVKVVVSPALLLVSVVVVKVVVVSPVLLLVSVVVVKAAPVLLLVSVLLVSVVVVASAGEHTQVDPGEQNLTACCPPTSKHS